MFALMFLFKIPSFTFGPTKSASSPPYLFRQVTRSKPAGTERPLLPPLCPRRTTHDAERIDSLFMRQEAVPSGPRGLKSEKNLPISLTLLLCYQVYFPIEQMQEFSTFRGFKFVRINGFINVPNSASC